MKRSASMQSLVALSVASSGATAGLQWQPQQDSGLPDEGLWTSVLPAGGGQSTLLGRIMPSIVPIFARPVSAIAGEPPDVVVVSGPGGTVVVNGNPTTSNAVLGTLVVPLGPYAVSVLPGLDVSPTH